MGLEVGGTSWQELGGRKERLVSLQPGSKEGKEQEVSLPKSQPWSLHSDLMPFSHTPLLLLLFLLFVGMVSVSQIGQTLYVARTDLDILIFQPLPATGVGQNDQLKPTS